MFLVPKTFATDWIGRLLAAIVAGTAALLLSGPALAGAPQPPVQDGVDYGFDISATVHKEKNTALVEAITRDKDIKLDVQVMAVAAQMVEALVELNQRSGGSGRVHDLSRTIRLFDAANRGSGIRTFNLTTGSMNNQTSSVSGTARNVSDGDAFVEAQAGAGQVNSSEIVDTAGEDSEQALAFDQSEPLVSQNVQQMAVFDESANDGSGAIHVNLSSGIANNQANAMSMALGLGGGGVALSDAALGQANSGLAPIETNVRRMAYATGSINRNVGVVGTNQASGNYGNQANILAIGAATIN